MFRTADFTESYRPWSAAGDYVLQQAIASCHNDYDSFVKKQLINAMEIRNLNMTEADISPGGRMFPRFHIVKNRSNMLTFLFDKEEVLLVEDFPEEPSISYRAGKHILQYNIKYQLIPKKEEKRGKKR